MTTAGSHDGRGDGPPPELQTRITLRPVGSSLPLGFPSFGIGMLLLGCSATGWSPVAQQPEIGLLLIAFVFPLELVATVFAFLARDTMGATTLGLFTTSWLALGWSDRVSGERDPTPPAALPNPTPAMYGGAALGIDEVRRRELLPLFRRRGAQRAFEGYGPQLERLETEPGIRQQL